MSISIEYIAMNPHKEITTVEISAVYILLNTEHLRAP